MTDHIKEYKEKHIKTMPKEDTELANTIVRKMLEAGYIVDMSRTETEITASGERNLRHDKDMCNLRKGI